MAKAFARVLVGVLCVVAATGAAWWYRPENRLPAESIAAPAAARTVARLAIDPGAVTADDAEWLQDDGHFDNVPAGSHVDVDERSWYPETKNTGSIVMTVTGPAGPPMEVMVTLRYRWGSWKVVEVIDLATEEAPEPTPRPSE
jgi:hypothetical protein